MKYREGRFTRGHNDPAQKEPENRIVDLSNMRKILFLPDWKLDIELRGGEKISGAFWHEYVQGKRLEPGIKGHYTNITIPHFCIEFGELESILFGTATEISEKEVKAQPN